MSISTIASAIQTTTQAASQTSSQSQSTAANPFSEMLQGLESMLESMESSIGGTTTSSSPQMGNDYGFSAGPGSVQAQLTAQGQTWTASSAPITAGTYVQDILQGRLNQPAGRGDIGIVTALTTGPNNTPVAQVDFGNGYTVGIDLSELSSINVEPQTADNGSASTCSTGQSFEYALCGSTGNANGNLNFAESGDISASQLPNLFSDVQQIFNDEIGYTDPNNTTALSDIQSAIQNIADISTDATFSVDNSAVDTSGITTTPVIANATTTTTDTATTVVSTSATDDSDSTAAVTSSANTSVSVPIQPSGSSASFSIGFLWEAFQNGRAPNGSSAPASSTTGNAAYSTGSQSGSVDFMAMMAVMESNTAGSSSTTFTAESLLGIFA